MRWLLAACGSAFIFCVVSAATFVPLQNPDGVEYLFVWPTKASLVGASLACAGALALGYFTVLALARRRRPGDVGEASAGRWLAPLAALAVVGLGILPAVPGVGERGAVAGYLFHDLRWWWAAGCTALAAWQAGRAIGVPFERFRRVVERWTRAERLLLLDATLFATLIVWAVATNAYIRFDDALAGDEPKYIRYCELWYQGGGLDISRGKLVADQRIDAAPAVLRNGGWLLDAAGEDLRGLPGDLAEFARHPFGFRWNRARAGNGFVTGRFGGIYQIHEPGVSVFLFPGYFLDRYLLNVDSTADGKFPARLNMTNVMMLLVYAVAGVMLFRLLRRALPSEYLAWGWTAVAMMAFPMSAFAFQFYPELPALLIIVGVSHYLLFGDPSSRMAAAAAGGAAGALAWLHPRFLATAFCLLAFGLAWRRPFRSRFALSFSALLLTLMAYDYHVTGSWLPTALWDAAGEGVAFNTAGFFVNVLGYGFDTVWGMLPHAPVLLLAAPGLFVLSRASRRHALFVTIVVLSLLGPAAGHTLSAAGTTPGRLVLAVLPLLFWPVAVIVRRFWASSMVRVTAVTLIVLSLDAALAYNLNQTKPSGALTDVSVSGWKPNLAFPVIRGGAWDSSPANFLLFLGFVVLIAAVCFFAFVRSADGQTSARRAPAPLWGAAVAVVLLLTAGLTGATAASGDWTSQHYFVEDRHARDVAARALVARERCRICFSSAHAQTDWTRLEPNSARGAHVNLATDGLAATVNVEVEGDGRLPAFARVRVEFGDNAEASAGIVGNGRLDHAYAKAGVYQVKVWVRLRDGGTRFYADSADVR